MNVNLLKISVISLILLSPVLLYVHTPFTVHGSLIGGTQGGGSGNTQGATQGGGNDDTTSLDSGHYQNFKSCLSNAEVNGVATDKQVKDCGAKHFPNW